MKEKTVYLSPKSRHFNKIQNLIRHWSPHDACRAIKESDIYQVLKDATHLIIADFNDINVINAIVKAVADSKNLYKIEFNHIQIDLIDYYISQLINSLSKSYSVHSFKMSNCAFSGDSASKLGSYLYLIPNLNYVDLSNNNIGKHIPDVVGSLLRLPFILKIDVRSNYTEKIKTDGLPCLEMTIAVPNPEECKKSIYDIIETYNSVVRENNQSFFQKINSYFELYNFPANEFGALDIRNTLMKQIVGEAVAERGVKQTIDVIYE